MATPMMMGRTAIRRFRETGFPNIIDMAIEMAGIKLRMTWLKLTET